MVFSLGSKNNWCLANRAIRANHANHANHARLAVNWPGLVVMALALVFVMASHSDAEAGFYGKRFQRQNAHGFVVAESWYGRGTIRGRVRATRLGPQVRLPRGTWIYCEISCSHTLRVNTLDFWENQGQDSDGIGILRYDRPY